MNKGILIAFEGPDGSGKTTQIEMLGKYLVKKGFDVIKTREPGGTVISEKIRDIILDNKNKDMCAVCEALLYAASRAQLVDEVIKPALQNGKIVLCDRFVLSSLVYQGIGRGIGVDVVKRINDAAIDGLKVDMTIMLKISYESGLKRKQKQKKLDRLENSGNEFHKKVFEGYLNLCKNYDKIKIIEGNRKKEEIHKDIVRIVDNLIRKNS